MSEPLLRVEHLSKRFGKWVAVDNISFTIRSGEVFALVGESGCGKTTTGRCILRLHPVTDGNIYFQGQRIAAGTGTDAVKLRQLWKHPLKNRAEIARLNRHRRQIRKETARWNRQPPRIQMVFQDPAASLDPRMTLREIVGEGLRIDGHYTREQLNEQVDKLLALVGLSPDYGNRYPHELSGGQRQRVCIARSLIVEPALLIADEPLSSLDVSVQAQIVTLLEELRRRLGLSILFIAHDLAVVRHFSDRIGVMYRGKLVEIASDEELFRHPLHPYTRALLSAIPQPDPYAPRKRVIYDPARAHDYRSEAPFMQEIVPGHFVLCNTAEAERYRKERGNEED